MHVSISRPLQKQQNGLLYKEKCGRPQARLFCFRAHAHGWTEAEKAPASGSFLSLLRCGVCTWATQAASAAQREEITHRHRSAERRERRTTLTTAIPNYQWHHCWPRFTAAAATLTRRHDASRLLRSPQQHRRCSGGRGRGRGGSCSDASAPSTPANGSRRRSRTRRSRWSASSPTSTRPPWSTSLVMHGHCFFSESCVGFDCNVT